VGVIEELTNWSGGREVVENSYYLHSSAIYILKITLKSFNGQSGLGYLPLQR
jgi:hypothetical protein